MADLTFRDMLSESKKRKLRKKARGMKAKILKRKQFKMKTLNIAAMKKLHAKKGK